MKKLALMTMSILGLQAGILDTAPMTVFKKATPYEESKIGFELINKSKRPIWVALTNGENTTRAQKVEAAGTLSREGIRFLKIDIAKPTFMGVWYSDPGQIRFGKKFGIFGAKEFNPTPNMLYTFTQDKTMYLSWDKANYARPQTGPLKGILDKTDSGLSLKQNVKKEDITEIPLGSKP